MNNRNNHEQVADNQFVISYELLLLFRWMVEHDYEKLKKIVLKSLSHGLKYELEKIDTYKKKSADISHEAIQSTIIEFFTMIESILLESLNDYAVQKMSEKNLMPAIDQIDPSICDDAVVRSSIEGISAKIGHRSDKNAQQVLFRELLKRWKPTKKAAMN